MSYRGLSHAAALVLLVGGASAQLVGERRLDTMNAAGATESDEPELAVAGNSFHAVWYEMSLTTNRDIYYSRSTDEGRTWSAPVRLDQDPGVGDQDDPIILAEGNVVFVAWMDDRAAAGVDDVFARVSTDGGATFAPEVSVSGPLYGDVGDADRLRGAMSLPYVHVGFEDSVAAGGGLGVNEDYWVASSSNGGASFAAPKAVNHPPAGLGLADVDAPELGAVGAVVHVAWLDKRNGLADHVYYNRSTDGGATYAALDTLLDSGAAGADTGDLGMTVSGSNVYLGWQDDRDDPGGTDKVYMNASKDGGVTWLGDERVDSAVLDATAAPPSIAAEGTEFFVTWVDNRNDSGDPLGMTDVFLARGSVATGALVVGANQRMDIGSAPGAANNSRPRGALKNGVAFLLYQDSRNDPVTSKDSLFLRVSQPGAAFGAELVVAPGLTGADDAEENNIAVSDGLDVVCLWADNRNGAGVPRPNDIYANYGCFLRATAVSRNGTGVNPVRLANVTPPVLGTTWTVTVDCSGFAPNLCGVLGYGAPATGPVIKYGELLVNVAGPKYYQFLKSHSGNVVAFGFPLPLDTTFCGIPVSNQAVVFGSPGAQLTNAIDIVVGGTP